jgi:hypothetical protein
MLNRLMTLALAGALSLGLINAATASQGTGCMPTTGTVSGLVFSQNVNSAVDALTSSFSGASPPATACSGASLKGQPWLDTSVTPNLLKQYDGTSWVVIGALDASNHLWAPPVGGGAATIASAATTDLWSNAAASITINGTGTITALANASAVPGTLKVVTVGGAFTMTAGAALELPIGLSGIPVSAGDRFLAIAKTSTNVAVFAYTKADGSAVVNPSVPIGTTLYGEWGTIPSKTVYKVGQALSRAAYPDYFNAMTRVLSGTLTAGNNTITGLSNTSGFGPGMPIEGTGVQAGTTIVSVSGGTVVMSQTATANGAQSIRVFITGYGAGGDSNTVGVTDCRGRGMAGRDDMLVGPANRLTASAFGQGYRIAAPGGAEAFYQAQNQLPNVALTFTGTNDPVSVNTTGGVWAGNSAFSGGPSGPITLPAGTQGMASTGTFTPRGSISSINGGVSQALTSSVQPTQIAECVVVVLP